MATTKLGLIFFCLIFFESSLTQEFLRVCYFQSWARYRKDPARYEVGDIDPNLCTHLIYAFGKLNISSGELEANEAWAEEGENGKYSQFNDLKKNNPSLKTMISIGGQNDHSQQFMAITKSKAALQHFTTTTIAFLRQRRFDGLDIDWEYPDSSTKTDFTNLLMALRNAFDADTATPKLLLSFAGPAGQWNIDPGYDVKEIAKYVDFANLMTYDYTDKSAQLAAFNSPLFSRNDYRFNAALSTNWTVHYWNSLGLPWDKIVVGITGVGRWLVLQNVTNFEPGSKVTGEVRKEPDYNLEAGLAYPHICKMLANSSTTRIFDQEQKNPYLVNADNWVGYEDKESIEAKIQWMKDLKVKGLMFWALDYDDFRGDMCNDGRYPLLKKVSSLTATPSSQTTQISSSQTTQIPSSQSTQQSSSDTNQSSSSQTTQIPSSQTTQIPSSQTTQIPSSQTTQPSSSQSTQRLPETTVKPNTGNSSGRNCAKFVHASLVDVFLAAVLVVLSVAT